MPTASLPQRLRHLLLNSAVFGLCYTSTNLLAQREGVVRNVATALDWQIPFVPWMLLPYALSGVFFVSSFWAARSTDALRVLSQRLLLATVLACIVFALLPLRFGMARPALTSPLWATLYAALDLMDQPYNQLPSLHVAYACIFWPTWSAWRTPWLWAVRLALALLVLSTLLTYQHHLADVVTGAALGLACVAGVRPGRSTPWVALYYTLGAGVVLVLARVWASTLPLLLMLPLACAAGYVALCLLLVARAYALGDADFLHKRAGRFPWWVWALYGPYLLGYALTWRAVQWRERQHPPYAQITPLLWVGRRLSDAQARTLPAHCMVVDVANELSETPLLRRAPYHHVPLLDLTLPDATTTERVLALLHQALQCGQPVYLHCAMGYSRARQLAAAYLERYPLSSPHHTSHHHLP